VVGASEGQFRFETDTEEVGHTIRASVTELLLECCRMEDEAAQ
jgi:hypothetical protein